MKTNTLTKGYVRNALRRLRDAGKLPETAVSANALGYKTEASVTQWFRGTWPPPIETLCELARIIDIEPSSLVLLWLSDLAPREVPVFREMAQGLMHDPEKVRSLFAEVGESAPPFWS